MSEFWVSFRNVCQLEFRNVSILNLVVFSLIGAIIVHIGCIVYVRMKRHSIYLRTELMIILLIIYTLFIAQVTLLSREPEGVARVFDTKWLGIDASMNQNITNILNIALFIPFGILIALIQINKKSMRRIFMTINYCFLTSVFIECTQYITRRGYFEIDDLEANIIGGMTGSIFFSLFRSIGRLIYKRNTEVSNEKESQARNV